MRVDVREVIRGKNPKLLKILPKFLINWVAKLIHQEEINSVLEKSGHLVGHQFASATLEELNIKYRVHNREKLDTTRRYIIVSNHPLGGLDGVIMIELFGKIFPEVKFVVNDLLYHLEPLKPVFIPVNKYGRQSGETFQMVKESYESEAQILYFPAGLCSRKIDGSIIDVEWRKSYITQAIKYKRDILPVYFSGKNSNLFYRIANWRKKMGIKFNFETILLPHEMFRQKGSTFDIFLGQPVLWEELTTQKDVNQWNQIIRSRVYSLK